MKINEEKYKLSPNNFIKKLSLKKQIVIGNTFNNGMKHTIGWNTRYNGNYKKTAHFTISLDGTIYKHFDSCYCSEYFGDTTLDGKSIIILIENNGWVLKDAKKTSYITWNGDIYNKDIDEIVVKKWRGHEYWEPYTEKQIESAVFLVREVCEEFLIPLSITSHNTNIDDLRGYSGVLYKSNIDKKYTDLSPSWDFIKFKNKLENKKS